jgi:hypothetical protein
MLIRDRIIQRKALGFVATISVAITSACAGSLGGIGLTETTGSLPVVAAAESPKPSGQGGWNCFEYRTNRGESSSRCLREAEGCRSEATRQEGAHGGSTSNPIRYKVGFCGPQPAAYCHYIWYDPSGGEHRCFEAESDCASDVESLKTNAAPGRLKQSACSRYE